MLNQEQQIFEQIKKAKNIIITFANDWSGDGLASALALSLYLKKMDKEVDIITDKFEKNTFSFLPGFSIVKHSLQSIRNFVISLNLANAKVDHVKYKIEGNSLNFVISPKTGQFEKEDVSCFSSNYKYDLIIVLDTPDIEHLGKIYEYDSEFFYQVPIINIDHHSSNEEFGQINYINLTAVSTTEVLFNLINEYSRELISEDIATNLLTGMIAKTRSFKSKNVTPNSLSTTAQLISMGADRDKIVNELYRSRSIGVLKLWGRALARLSSSNESQLVWSLLSKADFEKTNTNEDDLKEVIDELISSIPDAKLIILIHEDKNSKEEVTNVHVNAIKNFDAFEVIKEFSPKGSKNFAKVKINKSLHDTEKLIIEHIKGKMGKAAHD